jgi:two-component system, LytTR family, sensor kinase
MGPRQMIEEINQKIEMGRAFVPWWKKRWVKLVLVWAIWSFIGAIFTLQSYFMSYRSERPIPFVDALYLQMTWSYLWALATPLVLRLVHKITMDRHDWVRGALIHAPLSVVLSVALTGIGHVLLWLHWGWPYGKSFSFERLTRFVIGNFSEGVGMYLLIGLVGYAFSYYRRYREGELRSVRLEAQLSQAQLQALKMQLHPHFLFNTLHSISALLHHQPDAARTMITRLGDFLRLTLENSGTQEVTLKKEMEFLRCYLEIERVRFQDRLMTRVNVSPPALDARVPNLILQPIVENAIRHGIAPRATPGLIEILAKPQNGSLRIQIRDNGPGLPTDRNSEALFTKGLGLANTERRLERLYGTAHRFDLTNDPQGGLVVTLEIPFRNGAANGSANGAANGSNHKAIP